jgi:hypothetical protein
VAVLIHPYPDHDGSVALIVEYFDSVTTNTVVQYDSTGAHFLANNAVADKAFAPDGIQFILDVCYISNQGFEYSDKAVLYLGDNLPI